MCLNTNQWQFVGPLTTPRYSFAAVSLEDKLFVFGGYDGASSSKSIECFNTASHLANVQWESVSGCSLPTEMSSASAVTISDLPNAMHLTYYGQCLLQGDVYKPTRARKEYAHKAIANKLISAAKKSIKSKTL